LKNLKSSEGKNKEDVDLLFNNPPALVEKYQPIIEIIIAGFIKKRFFIYEDKDEVKQMINEKLLTKIIYRIQETYNGTAYLNTYFSKIVSNLCLEIQRSRQWRPVSSAGSTEDYDIPYEDKKMWSSLVIEGELKRVSSILLMYNKSGEKLKLLLKLLFNVSISGEDVLLCFTDCNEEDKKRIVAVFSGQGKEMNDKDIYEIITPYLNKYGNKNNTVDAIRKWMDLKTDEMIELLNGNPKHSNYTKETFKILIQKYFEETPAYVF